MGPFNDFLGTPLIMANSDDHVVIDYVEDGEQWAQFFSTLLMAHNYDIKSVLHNLLTPSSLDGHAQKPISSTDKKRSSVSRETLGDSGLGNRTISGTAPDSVDCSRTRVIIISPVTLTIGTFPLNVRSLSRKKTVFLFLGVEIENVRSYFGSESDYVFACHCCHIYADNDNSTVRDALVQIIEAFENNSETSSLYEDDENPYENPPLPRQANKIEVMITKELCGKDRDVYFLMERPVEETLTVVVDSCPGDDLPVTCVCDRLCQFTLSDQATGEIFFRIQSGNHIVGEGSVLALTKLDRLKTILNEEINPLSLIASALGLLSDDLDSIDTALAHKLKQLSHLDTLQHMFLHDESLDVLTDERADVMYPTLLHFAADWNLRKFCSELLRYPSMLDAALLENKNGDDPRSLAFNKGFLDIEDAIIQFVDKNSAENSLYILPSSQVPIHRAPPRSHTVGKSAGYVNEQRGSSTASGNYITMNKPKKSEADTSSQSSVPGTISPSSYASDNVFTTPSSYKDELDEIDSRHFSTGDTFDQPSDPAPGGIALKARKVLGMNENTAEVPKASTISRIYSRSDGPAAMSGNIPHGVRYHAASNMFASTEKSPVSSPQHEDLKSKPSKFSTFFGKVMKSKRSVSEGEIVYTPVFGGKKTQSTRFDKSKKKSTDLFIQERDSGSYSDEENGKKRANSDSKSMKPKEFKERDKPMARQRPLSKRIQLANREHVKGAPSLPTHNRSGFTSFIE